MKDIVINNKKALLITFGVMTLVIAAFALSYAYMEMTINTINSNVIDMNSDRLRIIFNDGDEIYIASMTPGMTITKTFTVQNLSAAITHYDLSIIDVANTFTGSDLVYSLSSVGGASLSERTVPSTNTKILSNVLIAANTTHTYTYTIKFKSTGSDQSANMNSSFNAKLKLEESAI